ncbi:glycoside hydrolase family 3 C-terminal domain-containing protein [Haliea sp. E17]|uniref:glycoside hydrolase family 3 C-terminal domain-containing protein n=1 Tax=Haliea sp. E17 TaxID=3401576 RepID=UPI003AAE435B
MHRRITTAGILALTTGLGACQQTTPPTTGTDLNGNGRIEPYENTALDPQARSEDLIGRLGIEQKIDLVMGTGFSNTMGGSSKVPGAAGSTAPLPDFGIPSIELTDGPAGVRINPQRDNDPNDYYATAFPIATTLASTWNPELVAAVGAAMGNEVKEYGTDILLAPGMNIQLNPRGGRNYEYLSEDPLLSGKMAAAIVKGVQSQGVGATVKHFVANNLETSRMVLNAEVDEQALREIYLRGFQIAIKESQPWAVMTSYNKLNGTYTSQDPVLLKQILRHEWGFGGLVMSDWLSGDDSVAQLQAGNDLIMPGRPENREEIIRGLADGSLTEADLDHNLRRILPTVFKAPSANGYPYTNRPELKANAATARQAAAEGVVLLKNRDATLPLKNIGKVAVFGNTSYDFISGGTGSGDVNEAYTVSLVEALASNDIAIEPGLQQQYLAYAIDAKAKQPKRTSFFQFVPPIAEMPVSPEQAAQLARSQDMALITIGRNSGEFQDRPVEGDFYLTETEQAAIATVSEAFHSAGKKVVLVLNIGNVVETRSWQDKVDAIVLPWQGGQEAGNAVVDVLTGKVNPSGRLSVTFPVRYEQIPSAETFPGEVLDPAIVQNPYFGGLPNGQRSQLQYIESIYVGYRYFDSFDQPVAFPFGFGLSYTDFAISEAGMQETAEGHFEVAVTVTNRGSVAGKQVLQLYSSAPSGKLPKAERALVAFGKTRQLAPGESQALTLSFTLADLASFDTARHQWVAEAGDYSLALAASSRDSLWQTRLVVDHETLLSPVLTALPPSTAFKVITP